MVAPLGRRYGRKSSQVSNICFSLWTWKMLVVPKFGNTRRSRLEPFFGFIETLPHPSIWSNCSKWLLCIIGQSWQNREKNIPPFLPPHRKGGGGEDTFIKNCAKKRRVKSCVCCTHVPFFGAIFEEGVLTPPPFAVGVGGPGGELSPNFVCFV